MNQVFGSSPSARQPDIIKQCMLAREDNGNYAAIEEFPDPEGTMVKLRRFKSIGPGYFETMGNRLVAGRSITWNDTYEQRPVVIISEPLAREYWGEPAAAIGKRLRGSSPRFPWREIIGVSGSERDDGLTQPPTQIVYWPMLNESYRCYLSLPSI